MNHPISQTATYFFNSLLVEKYDLEKITTIGDCYMVASAVPCPRPDHAVALVNLALDMQAVIAEHRFGGRQLAFRIGINSDPVVAGVIGRKKFIYELWGETVNLASRMNSWPQPLCSDYAQHLRLDQGLIRLRGAGID